MSIHSLTVVRVVTTPCLGAILVAGTLLSLTIAAAQGQSDPAFVKIPIDTAGMERFTFFDMNDAGVIAGSYNFPLEPEFPTVWIEGQFQDLRAIARPQDTRCFAKALNDSFQVVGVRSHSSNHEIWRWTDANRNFEVDSGEIEIIFQSTLLNHIPEGIDNSGRVFGVHVVDVRYERGWVYDTSFEYLDRGADHVFVLGKTARDAGQMVGWWERNVNNQLIFDYNFTWDGASETRLPDFAGLNQWRAFAINNQGDAVGNSFSPNLRAGYLDSDGTELVFEPNSLAVDINDAQSIVGGIGQDGNLWVRNGPLFDTYRLADLIGEPVGRAKFINNAGDILVPEGLLRPVEIDTDGDGLFDIWEEQGMDINNDGIVEIDFPALGADPLHKDLFLEVDIMDNVPLINDAIEDVVFAFAFADVENPDGFPGITLHIDLPTADVIPFEESWDRDFVRFGEIKDGSGGNPGMFGTQEDRDSVNSEAILEAKARTFRYCTIVNKIIKNDGKRVLGMAERPGDDMMIGVGTLAGDRHVQGSTFMHELGHMLSLQHGGGQDINYKTNHVSVMNYGFDHWCDADGNPLPLDYSSEAMLVMVEDHLDETRGIESVLYADVLVFHGYDNGSGGRQIAWVQLDSPAFDWNHDGSIDTDVAVDLNFVGSGYPDGNTASAGDVYFGFNEWQLLILPLGTEGNYADRTHTPPESDDKTMEDLIFMRENLPPAPINVAELTDVQILRGTILAGGTAELAASDNTYLQTRSGFGSTIADAHTTEIIVSATTNVPTPATLDVMVESRLSHTGGTVTLSLKNWNSGAFEWVGSYPLNDEEATNFVKQIDASNYVGPGGQIELKIKDVIHVPFLAFQYQAFIDQVQITAR